MARNMGRPGWLGLCPRAVIWISSALAFLALSPGVSAGQQQAEIASRFREAVEAFNSSDPAKSKPILDTIVEAASVLPARLTSDSRSYFARALALRAEVLVELGQEVEAGHDLEWLLQLDERFELERRFSSDILAGLMRSTRSRLTGRIGFKPNRNGKIWVDGRRVDNSPILVESGTRLVMLELMGVRISRYVDVSPGRVTDVAWPVAQTTASSPPFGFAGHPGGRLLLRLGGAVDAAGDDKNPSSGVSAFDLNGQKGSLGASYVWEPQYSLRGGEVGASVRLSGFLVGVAWMKTKTAFRGDLTATIPAQIGGPERSVKGTTTPLDRHQDALHMELGVALGSHASVFVGPSLIRARQALVTDVRVSDQTGGPSLSGFRAQELVAGWDVGFNLGFEGSVFFSRHIGVGGDLRYSRASRNVPWSGGSTTLVLGGYQFGFGTRLRF